MNVQRISLDHNATTPVAEPVREAVLAALSIGGNASSVHGPGRAARRIIESARADVAKMVGARAEEIIFTSGGTEANNLAIHGVRAASLIISAVEHDSVRQPARASGLPLFMCPVDGEGVVRLDMLAELLGKAPAPALVSVMLANNETGVLQPLGEIAELARRCGAILHCDAVQGPGRMALDSGLAEVDLLSLSGHKIGAPQGIGALRVREGLVIDPMLRGGGHERRRRAGTENMPGIAGFGAAARMSGERLAAIGRVASLRDMMESRILAACPGARVFGAGAARLANCSALAMPGMAAETQVMAFDLEGIAVSAGSACSSGKVTPSHVLAAMGVEEGLAGETIRVSLGPETTSDEIGRFIEVWLNLATRAAARRAPAA